MIKGRPMLRTKQTVRPKAHKKPTSITPNIRTLGGVMRPITQTLTPRERSSLDLNQTIRCNNIAELARLFQAMGFDIYALPSPTHKASNKRRFDQVSAGNLAAQGLFKAPEPELTEAIKFVIHYFQDMQKMHHTRAFIATIHSADVNTFKLLFRVFKGARKVFNDFIKNDNLNLVLQTLSYTKLNDFIEMLTKERSLPYDSGALIKVIEQLQARTEEHPEEKQGINKIIEKLFETGINYHSVKRDNHKVSTTLNDLDIQAQLSSNNVSFR